MIIHSRVPNRPDGQCARRRVFRLGFCALIAILPSAVLSATEADDPAWRNFQHGLGQPALIGANADHPLAASSYRPVPAPAPGLINREKFQLGSQLFHEGRLSSGNSVACITCHAGGLIGADRRPVSTGVAGAQGTMNALSVSNAGFNFRQFWDGRAVTLEEQALLPIQNDVEMANSLDSVLQFLRSDAAYNRQFRAVYPDGVTILNMADAIAHFQRSHFIWIDTPFQRYLAGDQGALGEQALRGLRRFNEIGCASCHNGINLGGNSYQKLGAVIPYYPVRHRADIADTGVMTRSGREQDRYVFRVPGLHGVATTSPYFHDGSVATLHSAIEEMARYELGLEPDPADMADIAAFLNTLGDFTDNSRAAVTGDAGAADGDRARNKPVPAPPVSHAQAYLVSISAIEDAEAGLVYEMERIHSGEVAHFDFLQFQYREMIRHARALLHPPSALEASLREQLVVAAQALSAPVYKLEWLIADFLRAEAMLDIYTARQQETVIGTVVEDGGTTQERLTHYGQLAASAMEGITSTDIRRPAGQLRLLYNGARTH